MTVAFVFSVLNVFSSALAPAAESSSSDLFRRRRIFFQGALQCLTQIDHG
jgi:hypothetical protein